MVLFFTTYWKVHLVLLFMTSWKAHGFYFFYLDRRPIQGHHAMSRGNQFKELASGIYQNKILSPSTNKSLHPNTHAKTLVFKVIQSYFDGIGATFRPLAQSTPLSLSSLWVTNKFSFALRKAVRRGSSASSVALSLCSFRERETNCYLCQANSCS